MHWKCLLSICVLGVAVGQAKADTINFSQFGPIDTQLSSPLTTGFTTGGVSVTLVSPTGSFFTRVEQPTGGGSWQGIFPSGAPLLWDGDGQGIVTLTFATPIQSLTLAAQAFAFGDFTQTMQAFNVGNTLLDTEVGPLINNCGDLTCEGTHVFLTVFGLDITRVTVSVTHDSAGFALYGDAGVEFNPNTGGAPAFRWWSRSDRSARQAQESEGLRYGCSRLINSRPDFGETATRRSSLSRHH